mmetsp:Transcript_13424/g.40707  ORF Transcript_13424/g.40707 Transcript_13424/m.40707 type:complete len:101 (+) Transcript_13424:285-587(+)|eukprot:scaffold100419_cov32-Tisochrysis_lutea.AAC.3
MLSSNGWGAWVVTIGKISSLNSSASATALSPQCCDLLCTRVQLADPIHFNECSPGLHTARSDMEEQRVPTSYHPTLGDVGLACPCACKAIARERLLISSI